MDKNKKLSLNLDAQNIKLDILEGSCGNPVVDIKKLPSVNLYTYDPGYSATASCESKITYIDGIAGILRYRGYPIEELAAQSNYLEICYLLFFGELPTATEYQSFCTNVRQKMLIDPNFTSLIETFAPQAHPMAMMGALTNYLSALHHGSLNISDPADRQDTALNIIALMPILAAVCYKHSQGEETVEPRSDLPHAANFLHMLHSTPKKTFDIPPIFTKAMDLLLILHADHEQNASTSSVRLVGSSGGSPYTAIGSGIASLWGSAHGGANEAVINMLTAIVQSGDIDSYISRAQDPDDSFRLMGFGHRIYKNFDPRAQIVRTMCHEVLRETQTEDKLFKIALELEHKALNNEYFISKKLYPNVDFYSGIIMRALGIPINLFTVIFSLGRSIGWISHWNEMLSEPYKIGRPRQLYTGETQRHYPVVNTNNLFLN